MNRNRKSADRKTEKKILHRWWMLAAMIFVAALISATTKAGDAALYGPAAPPGSAFIRVFNASDQADLEARVGNEVISDIAAWNVSDFIFVPAGAQRLSAGTADQSIQLAADRYYTAVVGAGGPQLLDNDRYGNRLKALVILYNLTDAGGLSLKTQDGGTAVVADVAPKASGSREVNAARVQLAVFKGTQRIADAPPVSLARGKAFSLFAVGDASAPRLVWAIN